MLNVNPEIICFIIRKAREFQSKEQVTIPEVPNSPAGDWAYQILADHQDDYCYQEVVATVNDLEPDQQAELVALMWLGREEYGIDEWDQAVKDARAELTDHTAQYLLAHPLVADFLQEGLNLHDYTCDE